jgi:hypothetical protein
MLYSWLLMAELYFLFSGLHRSLNILDSVHIEVRVCHPELELAPIQDVGKEHRCHLPVLTMEPGSAAEAEG